MDETKKPKKDLADEILEFDDERTELVTVPEWGNKKVLCKNMTGADRALLNKFVKIDSRSKQVTSESTAVDIVLLGAYNPETGEKLFKNPVVQKTQLLKKNMAAIDRLAEVINKLSGIGEGEEIEKN